MWLKANSSLLGREGKGDKSVQWKGEGGPSLQKGGSDLQLSALAHTDWIKAAEVQEEYYSSNPVDHWTTAKLLSFLIVFIAR